MLKLCIIFTYRPRKSPHVYTFNNARCMCKVFNPMPHMSLTDFVVFPPGHGTSVADFSGWDAHEARLRCPDDVSGDIGGCSARRALKPNFY